MNAPITHSPPHGPQEIRCAAFRRGTQPGARPRVSVSRSSSCDKLTCAHTAQEGICADSASFDLPAAHLAACIEEARRCALCNPALV